MVRRRQRRERGGWFWPLMLLFGLLKVAHELAQVVFGVPGAQQANLLDETRDYWDGGPAAGQGEVEVLKARQRISSRALLDDSALASGYYLFDAFGDDRVTASAMGVDRRHHIVNAYLVGILPFETDNLWVPLQTLAQRKTYQFDHIQYWGRQDIWQTSAQALKLSRGDCEDHSLALADWLISLGEDARVVVGDYQGNGHAWVVLFKDGEEFVFEATQKQGLRSQLRYPLARLMPGYHPQYMFNRQHFWTNTGSSHTTNYSSSHWVRKSRYWPEEPARL